MQHECSEILTKNGPRRGDTPTRIYNMSFKIWSRLGVLERPSLYDPGGAVPERNRSVCFLEVSLRPRGHIQHPSLDQIFEGHVVNSGWGIPRRGHFLSRSRAFVLPLVFLAVGDCALYTRGALHNASSLALGGCVYILFFSP